MRRTAFLFSLLCVLLVLPQDGFGQQLGQKVYWMATVEIPIGKGADYHLFVEQELMPLQEKHGYRFIAAWQTIVGDIEEAIIVAEFDSMAAYHQARVSLLSSAEWKTVGAKLSTFARNIKSRFLSATAYSRMK
jgi:uncharacterized protein (DUF1330 family)